MAVPGHQIWEPPLTFRQLSNSSTVSYRRSHAFVVQSMLGVKTRWVTRYGDAGANVVSVAEHVVMMILSLVRNYIPAYHQVIDGEWDIARIAEK